MVPVSPCSVRGLLHSCVSSEFDREGWGYTAITGWVADVPLAILTDVYLRSGAAPAPPPPKTTIWRVLTDADAGAVDVAVG